LHKRGEPLEGESVPPGHDPCDGALVLAALESLLAIGSLSLPLAPLGREGYVLRPCGICVSRSARFSAPKELAGLPTADPLDPRVRAWWKDKTDEVCRLIPDFGGLLPRSTWAFHRTWPVSERCSRRRCASTPRRAGRDLRMSIFPWRVA
jgi:hypothetical protein